jgi:hypothetical protein
MSITITGGISFSGAVSIVAPPSGPAGWFYGGGNPGGKISSIQRIIFASDTVTASVRGQLTASLYQTAAAGTSTDGWVGGGFGEAVSTVQRTTYATDTATASIRGPLTGVRYNMAATSDSTTYAWFGQGRIPGLASPTSFQRITFATDTNTATARGGISSPTSTLYSMAATGNTTDGWWGGLIGGASTVNRLTYATDTATASTRGPLSSGRYAFGAAGTTSFGWFMGGGGTPTGQTSLVDRITYSNDTVTATVRGPLSATQYQHAVTGDTTYGWTGGGSYPGSTTVQRITYATDTATGSVRGPLSIATKYESASAGVS